MNGGPWKHSVPSHGNNRVHASEFSDLIAHYVNQDGTLNGTQQHGNVSLHNWRRLEGLA